MYKEKFFVIIVTIGCINCVYIFPYIAPEAVARRAAPEKRRMIRAGLPLTARKSGKTAGQSACGNLYDQEQLLRLS